MAIEFLSDEQVRRYGAFVADPTPEELERFFFLNAAALEVARTKRRRHNRPAGWSSGGRSGCWGRSWRTPLTCRGWSSIKPPSSGTDAANRIAALRSALASLAAKHDWTLTDDPPT